MSNIITPLPTEAQWEYAARGGLVGADYVWGDAPAAANARPRANHWQGAFPLVDVGTDGFKGRASVGCFAANGYGLYDMAGNVWELTQTRWEPAADVVIKGGSWLCADNVCLRYRPAARQPGDPTLGTNHIGFRTVGRPRGTRENA